MKCHFVRLTFPVMSLFSFAVTVNMSALAVPVQSTAHKEIAAFTSGDVVAFRTKGHAKSLGLDMEFRYPSGWAKNDGVRPHIVVNVDSKEYYGPLCNLQIRRLSSMMSKISSISESVLAAEFISLSMADCRELAQDFFSEANYREYFANYSEKPTIIP